MRNAARNPLTVDGDHALLKFTSFNELIEHNENGKDYRSRHMDSEFYGAKSMPEAYAKAYQGLPREGITALNLAEKNVQQMDRELQRPNFHPYNDVSGCDVDVALYLTGEPECMVNYHLEDEPKHDKVVTIVASVSYHCGISKKAIKTQGQALMALMEAVETAGLQTEIWIDLTTCEGLDFDTKLPRKYTKSGRVAVRLKAPGEMFDAGMFMYALTHDSFLRSIIFNTMHYYPEEFRNAIGVTPSGGYGSAVPNEFHMEDFPEGAVHIPAISKDADAGKIVHEKLKELDLIKAANAA